MRFSTSMLSALPRIGEGRRLASWATRAAWARSSLCMVAPSLCRFGVGGVGHEHQAAHDQHANGDTAGIAMGRGPCVEFVQEFVGEANPCGCGKGAFSLRHD